MKYQNFILIVIAFCLIILSLLIYFKPTPNRFIIKEINDEFSVGYKVYDTATGRIYNDYAVILKDKAVEQRSVEDIVRNRVIKRGKK